MRQVVVRAEEAEGEGEVSYTRGWLKCELGLLLKRLDGKGGGRTLMRSGEFTAVSQGMDVTPVVGWERREGLLM